jgi:hypothetical protein
MKRFLPILLLVFSVGVGAETMDDLVKREGIYYKKFNDVPFTGNIQSKYNSGKVKTGRKLDSLSQYWAVKGQRNL